MTTLTLVSIVLWVAVLFAVVTRAPFWVLLRKHNRKIPFKPFMTKKKAKVVLDTQVAMLKLSGVKWSDKRYNAEIHKWEQAVGHCFLSYSMSLNVASKIAEAFQ